MVAEYGGQAKAFAMAPPGGDTQENVSSRLSGTIALLGTCHEMMDEIFKKVGIASPPQPAGAEVRREQLAPGIHSLTMNQQGLALGLRNKLETLLSNL